MFYEECVCGNRIEFVKGQAGARLVCPECQTPAEIKPLSKLNSANIIKKRIAKHSPIQFSLLRLILLFLPFAILAWVVDVIGWELTLIISLPMVAYATFVVVTAYLVHHVPMWRNAFWDSLRKPSEFKPSIVSDLSERPRQKDREV